MDMEKPRCDAKTRTGTRCKRYAVSHGRCRLHGKTETGLLSIYQDASQDTELLSVRAEIALLETMLERLLSKLDTYASNQVWQEIKATIELRRKLIVT